MHAARSIADKPGLQAGHWGSLKQIPIAGGEQEVGFFPVHAMKMSDFLALEKLEPHNDLVNKGLVRPLDFVGADKNAILNFVSHQWLGYEEADPNSNHLSTMQEVFKRAIAGESIFRSDEDWRAYSKGYTAVNAFSVQQTSGVVEHSGEQSDESAFRGGLRDGWVWMDYISIPQTIGCSSEEEVLRVMVEQKRAISSIPYYVQHAKNFWICAPSGAEHVDACIECNYNTWHARGWCRMEEAVFLLIRLGDGRPLLVTQPLGEPPRVKTLDRIDRAWNMTQRHTSVLTGAFSCCRLGHRVTSRDGKSTTIGCDREQLAGILERLFDEQVEKLRANFASEGGAELPFMKRVSHSMSFCHLWNFLNVKNLILADSLDEPDFVAEGWSKPFEELTQADYEAFCTTGYQGYGGFDSDPQGDLDMMAWNAAMMGHLPMLRYAVEKLGANPAHVNTYGMCPLQMACRFGNERCLRFLATRLDSSQINYQSGGLGISPLSDAAKCGHPKCVSAMLELGAHVDPRRKNGKTPLHEAAEHGFVECVRILCAAGADRAAVDNAGKTAADYAAESMPVHEAVLAVLLQ